MHGLLGFVVHVAAALGSACLVSDDLTRKDVAEGGKCVEEELAVHAGAEVVDEDVANTRLAQRGVALGPHDAAWFVLDVGEVHRDKGALGIRDVVEVHVRVPEGAAGHGVAAHSDGGDGADTIEHIEEEAL